LQALGLSGYII
jgi:hypothetical protein